VLIRAVALLSDEEGENHGGFANAGLDKAG
jgi:hypothetical protein